MTIQPKPPNLNHLSGAIIDAALKVHRTLGHGLLETVYEATLAYELRERGHTILTQLPFPVRYGPLELDCGFRIDLLVDNLIIVELKSVETLAPVHSKQLLTYLRLTQKPLGLLINFNVPLLKDGITRIVN